MLLAVLFIIWLSYFDMTPFQVFTKATFIACLSILQLLSDDKYVLKFAIQDDNVAISYITQFLQIKSLHVPVSDIKEIKLSKRSKISTIWSPTLDLKVDGKMATFNVITKELHKEVQLLLESANLDVVKKKRAYQIE